MTQDTPLLEVKHLCIDYLAEQNVRLQAIEDVSFTLHAGEILGMVGESGCGKSTLMLGLLRLLPVNGQITSGEVLFNGQDLLSLSEREMASIRWGEIAIVFQGAMNALNPVRTIGDQIEEAIACHEPDLSKIDRKNRVAELLELVGIAADRANAYAFQFSGGMRQRAMIAMALACHPKILIADEPTTALDVMIQAQILELLEDLRDKLGLAVIIITHDLGVIAEISDTVLVMYGGVTAERAPVDSIYNHPEHPYTQNLLKAFPDLSQPEAELISIPGYPPRLDDLPKGCRFAPRCPQVFARCRSEKPALYRIEDDHYASCFLVEEPQKQPSIKEIKEVSK
ncbi:MAG: ABC transporter ATP-binding protein [Anaerolineaceae bacterium]|jgi:peptide/nickel transport system ATP-binding protein